MTQSGHSGERLASLHEQEVAAIVTGLAHIGILRRLVGGDHDRTANLIEQLGSIDDRFVGLERANERLGKGRVQVGAVGNRLQPARDQR